MSRSATNLKTKTFRNKKANEFAFKSCLHGPIHQLSVLRQSLLFAEASMIPYLRLDECNIAAGKLGFSDGQVFDAGGVQAHWFQNEHDSVVVFRGREIDEVAGLTSNVTGHAALAETVGNVNEGFKQIADDIWPAIEKSLKKNCRSLWFCGHSVGGALATICAGRCMLSSLRSEPEAVFSYGSPRIGCSRYIHHVKLQHYRWVNNNDRVTRTPSVLASYRHSGTEMYLGRYGQLIDRHGWQRFKDEAWGAVSGMRYGESESLSNHSIIHYVDAIFGLVRAEEANRDVAEGAYGFGHQSE